MTQEHVDVLIVGAGLSGIGAAAHLQDECPGRTFAILEARGEADLVAHYVCRLLNHMAAHGYDVVAPVVPEDAGSWDPVSLIDLQSGYVLRSIDKLPRQGPAAPWRLFQSYPRDVRLMRKGPVDDGGVRFERVVTAGAQKHAL